MAMKVEYINPFIESVQELFRTMLQAEVARGSLGVVRGAGNPRDIMALIGISGQARGTVALALPTRTALNLVSRLLGADMHIVDSTVTDGVSEIVNMIAGNAKGKLGTMNGHVLDLSLPTIVRGSNFEIEYPTHSVWLDVPFTSDLGPFNLRVIMEENPSGRS